MPLCKTNAVILGGRRFGDSSKIISAYTADFGKLHLLAKGVWAPKSKFLSALETFSESELVFYHKTTTELHLLSQAALLKSHLRLADRADVFPFAAAACEVTADWIKGPEPSPPYFNLLSNLLRHLETAPNGDASKLFWIFVYLGASILGFRPNLEACFRCGTSRVEDLEHGRKAESRDGEKESRNRYLFHPEKGGLVCSDDARESERYLKVSAELKNLAVKLSQADFEHSAPLEISPKLVKELSDFLKDFLLVQGVWREAPRSFGLWQKADATERRERR